MGIWGPSGGGASAVVTRASVTVTFDGTAGGGAAGTAVPVLTVTGQVIIKEITAYCTSGLTEASASALISLGTTNVPDLFIANTGPETIDTDEWWINSSPGLEGQDLPAELIDVVVSSDIVITPTLDDTTGGSLIVTCWYSPVSSDGTVS